MDPNTTLATVLDIDADLEDRADAAAHLIHWLQMGGHAPRLTTRECARRAAANVLAEAWSAR